MQSVASSARGGCPFPRPFSYSLTERVKRTLCPITFSSTCRRSTTKLTITFMWLLSRPPPVPSASFAVSISLDPPLLSISFLFLLFSVLSLVPFCWLVKHDAKHSVSCLSSTENCTSLLYTFPTLFHRIFSVRTQRERERCCQWKGLE